MLYIFLLNAALVVSQILMCFILFSIQFTVFYFPWDFFSLTDFFKEVYCWFFSFEGFSSFIDFKFGFLVFRECTLYVWFQSLKFVIHNMTCYGICSVDTWKEFVYAVVGWSVFVNVYLILLLVSLSTPCWFSVQFFQLLREGRLKSPTVTLDLSLFLSVLLVLLCVFCNTLVWYVHI